MGQLFIFLDDDEWIRVIALLETQQTEQDNEISRKIRVQTGI